MLIWLIYFLLKNFNNENIKLMTDNQPEITIVGGGVVGLSIAVGLLQSGHK